MLYLIQHFVKQPLEILLESLRSFFSDDGFYLAAAVSFYTIISVIPILFLIFFVSGHILGSSEKTYTALVDFVRQIHPYVEDRLILEVKTISEKKGFMGWFGFAFLIWISTMLVSSLETAFTRIFRVEESRNPFYSLVMAIAVIPLGLIVILFDVVVSITSNIMEQCGLGCLVVYNAAFRHALPLAVIILFFTLIFKVIPHRKVPFSCALAGGLISTLFLEAAKGLFDMYLSLGGNPAGLVYGSLKALVYVVIWVFYLATIVLFSGEIVSTMTRRRAEKL